MNAAARRRWFHCSARRPPPLCWAGALALAATAGQALPAFPRGAAARPSVQAPALLPAPLSAQAPVQTPAQAAARNRRRFDAIWRTTRDRFYDAGMHGLDWRAVGDRYRAAATAARSKTEFQSVVNRMLDELRASHLAFYTDDDMEYYLLRSLFVGGERFGGERSDRERLSIRRVANGRVVTERIELAAGARQRDAGLQMEHIGVMGERERGVFVVRAVLDGGPAARAGVRAGDRLLAAGGRPFSTVGAFRGRAGHAVPLLLERPGAGQLTLFVTPLRQGPQAAFLDATRRSVRLIERGGKRLGYFHLWTMTNDRFRAALEDALANRFAATDGLILDLRDGFGGSPFGFSDVLFRPDIRVEWTPRPARSIPPRSTSPRSAAPRSSVVQSSVTRTGYDKPLVVIINRGTRSSKEYFAFQIKKSRRGPLIGTNTAGAFLAAWGTPIEEDGLLEVPVTGLKLNGRVIEGAGIAPDLRVEAADAYGPRDAQLARAVEVFLSRLRSPRDPDSGP